jgi:hypothetical protein
MGIAWRPESTNLQMEARGRRRLHEMSRAESYLSRATPTGVLPAMRPIIVTREPDRRSGKLPLIRITARHSERPGLGRSRHAGQRAAERQRAQMLPFRGLVRPTESSRTASEWIMSDFLQMACLGGYGQTASIRPSRCQQHLIVWCANRCGARTTDPKRLALKAVNAPTLASPSDHLQKRVETGYEL